MTISSRAREAMFAQETEEVFLTLLTIAHDSLSGPLRFVDNGEDIVSNGITYTAFPFKFEFPDVSADKPPRAAIKIDNIHRDIVAELRKLTDSPDIRVDVVLASQPDIVEISFGNLTLVNIQYDQIEITGELSYENVLVEPYPGISFSPDLFPGLL